MRWKAFLLAFTFFASISTAFYQPAFAQAAPPVLPQSGETETLYVPPEQTETPAPNPSQPVDPAPTEPKAGTSEQKLGAETNSVVFPTNAIQVKKRPFLIKFFDYGVSSSGNIEPDGDAITVTLNGAIIANDMLLTTGPESRDPQPKVGDPNTLVLDLQPGRANRLEVRVTGEGRIPWATIGWRVLDGSFGGSTPVYQGEQKLVGQSFGMSLQYAQVENARQSTSPQIADHMREAWALGKTRFCTKESSEYIILNGKSNAQRRDDRREDSLKKFGDGKPVPGFERDEYPPAACIENAGNAHIKLTDPKQNSSAGGVFGRGMNSWFVDYDTFEMIIGP
jgi:hypothetical protein